MKILLPFLFLPTALFGAFPPNVSSQVLYYMHKGDVERSINTYLDYAKSTCSSDHALLQEATVLLLEQGMKSQDPETELLTVFGAGVALNPSLISILEKGLHSKELRIQLASLNFLGKMDSNESEDALYDALASPFLIARLEAIFQMAKKNDPSTIEQLQALYVKVPKQVRPIFAEIVSPLSTPNASRFLKQLLLDEDPLVRIATVLAIAETGKDDLIPQIRTLLTHTDPASQEACLFAIGILHDEGSKKALENFAENPRENVRLAALEALYALGETEAYSKILEMAKSGEVLALSLINKEEEGVAFLKALTKHEDANVRLNAALALLEVQEEIPFPLIKEILIQDDRDLGYLRQYSPGKALGFWKIIPNMKAKEKLYPNLEGQTMKLRGQILRACLEQKEEDFITIARVIFEKKQFDLIPPLVELLTNHRSDAAVALLKEEQQHAGAPLIRNYCNLALYKLKEKGPYEDNLVRFVEEQEKTAMIRFKPGDEDPLSSYTLTPEETSQLLIESFETLATSQSERGIQALLHAIAYGNSKNRYALAGLLMRTTE